MDIEFNPVESSPVLTTSIGDQETTPKACNQRTKRAAEEVVEEGDNNDDDNDNDNDSDETNICPLFMNGLPRNFASNPQLAAIASLMNDDDDDGDCVQEDKEQNNSDNDCDNDECNTKNHNILDHKKEKNTSGSTPLTVTTGNRAGRYNASSSLSSSKYRRRRQNRASPYPQQKSLSKNNNNDNDDDKRPKTTKGASVGETTLFLNMWKL
jgi:hypothetical protein